MIIEGSGSGSIPPTNGSGSRSGRSKNIWIRWIRILNTGIQEEEERWAGNPWGAWYAAVLRLRHSLLRLGALAHGQLYSPGRRRKHNFAIFYHCSSCYVLFTSNSEENPNLVNEKQHISQTLQCTLHFLNLFTHLKGLSYEIDFENVDKNWQIVALIMAVAGFWIFLRHLLFLAEIKHLLSRNANITPIADSLCNPINCGTGLPASLFYQYSVVLWATNQKQRLFCLSQ